MTSRNSRVYFPRGDENREYVQPWKGLGTLNIPKKRSSQLLQQLLPTTSAHFLLSPFAGCSPHTLLCTLHNLGKSLN